MLVDAGRLWRSHFLWRGVGNRNSAPQGKAIVASGAFTDPQKNCPIQGPFWWKLTAFRHSSTGQPHIPYTTGSAPIGDRYYLPRDFNALAELQAIEGWTVGLCCWTNTQLVPMTGFVKENRLATIVGTRTAGQVLGGNVSRVGYRYLSGLPVTNYLTWNGTVLEGNGVQPDESIEVTHDSLTEGRDIQLERAVAIAESM